MRIARERQCDVIHAHGRAAAWSALLAARLTGIPVRHHLVQGLSRAEPVQAPVQRRHGARRPRHRGERADRATDQRPLRHAVGAHRGAALEHRLRALRSGARHARARRGAAARLGRQARHQGDPRRRPHPAPQGTSCDGARRRSGSRRWGSRISSASSSARIAATRITPANCGTWCWRRAPWTSSAWRRRSPTCRRPMRPPRWWCRRRSSRRACSVRSSRRRPWARPVIVSDLGAGPDVVLTAPAVPDGRVTGLRFAGRR